MVTSFHAHWQTLGNRSGPLGLIDGFYFEVVFLPCNPPMCMVRGLPTQFKFRIGGFPSKSLGIHFVKNLPRIWALLAQRKMRRTTANDLPWWRRGKVVPPFSPRVQRSGTLGKESYQPAMSCEGAFFADTTGW